MYVKDAFGRDILYTMDLWILICRKKVVPVQRRERSSFLLVPFICRRSRDSSSSSDESHSSFRYTWRLKLIVVITVIRKKKSRVITGGVVVEVLIIQYFRELSFLV